MSKNPMKPDPEKSLLEGYNFASDDAAEYAAEAVSQGLDMSTVVSTGKTGITKADITKALKLMEDLADEDDEPEEDEETDSEEGSEAADEPAAETDSDKAAKKEQQKALKEEVEKAGSGETKYDPPENHEFQDFLTEFMSFSLPVRGALNGKPKVQERWNELVKRAGKLRK